MSIPANQVVGDQAMVQWTSASTYANLGVIEDIVGNKITAAEVKVTKLSDPSAVYQPGIPDPGEVTVKMRFSASMNQEIYTLQLTKCPLGFKIQPADILANSTRNSEETILGFIKEFDPYGEVQQNKEIVSTLTLRLSGSGTLAIGV